MNYLHDIEPGNKDEFNVIIEIPKNSKNKYEIDKDTGLIKLDRFLLTAQDYPCNYGFVPRTHWYDNDALDVFVISEASIDVGVLVKVRPVGVLKVTDSGESDYKMLAVVIDDKNFENVKDVKDLNIHLVDQINHFLKTYKDLQGKTVTVDEIAGVNEAKKTFDEAINLYKGK